MKNSLQKCSAFALMAGIWLLAACEPDIDDAVAVSKGDLNPGQVRLRRVGSNALKIRIALRAAVPRRLNIRQPDYRY